MFYDILLCVIIRYVTFVPHCGNLLALGYRVSCVVCRVLCVILASYDYDKFDGYDG